MNKEYKRTALCLKKKDSSKLLAIMNKEQKEE
jgi:hypothetical protein